MQTGTWIRRGSTIELLESGPPAKASRETSTNASSEEDEFLSDLFNSVTSRARQGVDALKSRSWAPAPPARRITAPPRAAQPPRAPSTTRLPIPESALTSLLPAFTDYTYSGDVRYPWKLPGVSLKLAPPHRIDCCTFVEALVVRAWADTHGSAFTWNMQRHAQMMIQGPDLFSPVTAMVDAEMGIRVPPGEPPSTWCVAQGWRSAGGHNFIVVARHAPSDRVLILEANKGYGLNGVGSRNLGHLRDFPGGRPPARWWENSDVPRWSDILRAYSKGLELAQLNVQGASWAGLPAS